MGKHRSKEFNKFAWATRVTAKVIKLDLVIQCKALPKKDLLSQADSFCVLWQVPPGYMPTMSNGMPTKLPGRQEVEKGRTEVARACVDPTYENKFRLEFVFHEEQTFVIRVYDEDEDLRYATAAELKEHDYLGGCVFTLGQLMGSKGCTIAKKLALEKSYMIVRGEEILDTRSVLDFRFSCQDLIKERSLIDRSKVIDKSNPYFRLERLNKEDQSWEVVWKSEVIKDSLNPTWMQARLPLQLLCNDDQDNSLNITIWDYEKNSSSHDQMGFVETTVAELVSKAKEGEIHVMEVKREQRKLFGGSKLKTVGKLKVLKATVIAIPSMLQFLSGGCSLDLVVGIDCTLANGDKSSDKYFHYSASHWLNDYQAGIQKLGSILENFSRGRHSSIWGFGAKIKDEYKEKYLMADRLCLGKELLHVYDKHIVEGKDLSLGDPAKITPLVQAATFKTIKTTKRRQSYTVLCLFTAGNVVDIEEAKELVLTAAEDAPLSIILIGVGNRDFSAVEKLTGDKHGPLQDANKVPIARDIVTFVSFKQFGGNASEVIAEALKDVPEQFVTHFVNNGTKPAPPVPAPDYGVIASAFEEASQSKKKKRSNKSRSRSSSPMNGNNGKNRQILIFLASCLLAIPEEVVRVLLDYTQQTVVENDPEVLGTVTRMAGGALLAQGLSCFLLLLPLIRERDQTERLPVTLSRIAVAVQFITGLLWVIVGLLDDRINETGTGHRRKTFGILVVGFLILMLSCFALMLSFWPVDELEILASEHERLLASGDSNSHQVDEAVYQLLEDGPNESSDGVSTGDVATGVDNANGESGDVNADETTSRIRGTRRLLKLAAPEVRYLYIGCITLLIRLPFSLSIPHFVSTSLGALSDGDFPRARREVFWLFLLGTIDASLDFWCIFWFGYANQRIVRGVRIDTFASILRQEIGFFDENTSGELASRLNSDCGEMAGDLTWFFRFSIESVVRISGITAYMLVRSPKLGACALSIIPIVATVNKLYGNWLRKNATKVQDALAAANSVAQESFSCIRTVIAFASESLEHQKYIEKINEQYRLNVMQTFMTGVYYMFVSTFLINTVVQGTLLLVGSYMIQHGKLTSEILLAFMLYQGQLQNEMLNLFQSYSSLIKSSGAGDKVFGLLDRRPPPPATGSRAVATVEGQVLEQNASWSIELEDIGFSYPSRPENAVLEGLSLPIRQGQTVAIVGPSGCGKSTIVGLLQRFYDPTAGRTVINGTDTRSLDIRALRQRIGVVTQDPTLFSGTILSNIAYGLPNATMEDAVAAARRANAHDFISAFPNGYETEVGERGVQLSGGQKQRIAISRAIIRNPSLLLLDEATSALDADSEEIVQAALDSLLLENSGITTVIIAHRLRTVRNADAIAVVKQGQILEFGSHDHLMTQEDGYYRSMVEKSLGGNLADV